MRHAKPSPCKPSTAVLLACLILALLAPAVALAKKKPVAAFQGNVMAVGGAGGARGSVIEIRIDRWSTEEERVELLELIQTNKARTRAQTRALPDALQAQEKTGVAAFTGTRGYPLRYAARYEQGDGYLIILATNRQIGFREAGRSQMSMDYNVSVIVLTVDKEGKGTGVLSLATELVWNEEKQQIEPTVIDSQPARIENVRRVK